MLEPICKTDDYFGKCLKGLRSTISNQYEDDVRFNDYKIIQVSTKHEMICFKVVTQHHTLCMIFKA